MIRRRHARITGVVQGVGFRPFVARLARELGLAGSVRNDAEGVVVEIQGVPASLDGFAQRLTTEAPPAARIEAVAWTDSEPRDQHRFVIVHGDGHGDLAFSIPPDLGVCPACLAEVRDPDARRYHYPFTNCTHCGPRFTITSGLPWDRPSTSMAGFAMCRACAAEYGDPTDRRYHAQPIACSRCGPTLRLEDRHGDVVARAHRALRAAATHLREGGIVAMLGLGGFQLLVDATCEPAVRRLRDRKRRPSKPFAVMFSDLASVRRHTRIDAAESSALSGPDAPIVLLETAGEPLAPSIAPGLRRLGAMLPTTPLHALLLESVGRPLIATSGNMHEEPIVTDPGEGQRRLGEIADWFLVHDRPVLRRCDDSVVHVVAGRTRVLRAARGMRPAVLPLPGATAPILAAGGHLKNAPALAFDGRIVLWPHVGDMDTVAARGAFEEDIASLEALLDRRAAIVVTDAHPDYAPTRWARSNGRTVEAVYHHHAHVAACLAEHGATHTLGVAWDGVGLGPDHNAWGGELLEVDRRGARRRAHLLPFSLPGGDAAARDGLRCLAGLLAAAGLQLDDPEVRRFDPIVCSPRLSPVTTSVGRLFDGVAALAGIAERSSYEGEAAMRLEHAATDEDAAPYPFACEGPEIDWRPMLAAMLEERHEAERVASRFHATLVAIIVELVVSRGSDQVALGGGCFHNARLLSAAERALRDRGIHVLSPAAVPAGDGGLALGQAWIATSRQLV